MLIENALANYYAEIQKALDTLIGDVGPDDSGEFMPGARLPELTPLMRSYLDASAMALTSLPGYQGRELSLLDLTQNPATNTTKTFASLIIVARAIRFIQDTGERVTILTPSSANKAVALRDAVLRAIKLGLVRSDQLNIVVLVPAGATYKLRATELFTDPALRARNPVALYDGAAPHFVKTIARGVVDEHRGILEASAKTNLWYTMQLENYLVADVVRAFVEADFLTEEGSGPRLHAHSVSSAYGLLGHAYGRELLGDSVGRPSRYLLVQHLGTPDMVTSLLGNGDYRPPAYAFESGSGLYTQNGDDHFPARTFDPTEVLDPTFYTRNPVTSPRMNALIQSHGGSGIVVSLAECLERYGLVRSLLADADVRIPANPTLVQEWSLIMAMTGVLNAVDRSLVADDPIVVHGAGLYSRGDFEALVARELHTVGDSDGLRELVLQASVQ
ncbi:DUF6002 family protein [Streptomyces sp. DG2A-72]|uniref:DUF6002 family protein n=1 Tax=Streptomyces sp. DG2A-72 TaxID=3051386 RepID=UPI00265C7317|nr:DUF6002 family protein [Streptomyces sp. DG2A-72]MDO0933575.1 DUF6002 family protein [Streptomyces sp. DG2A-72]